MKLTIKIPNGDSCHLRTETEIADKAKGEQQ